jgi:hypothetical protein
MTPPETIPFSSIVFGERGRTEYRRIPELAQSILDNGLIQPLVLVPTRPTRGNWWNQRSASTQVVAAVQSPSTTPYRRRMGRNLAPRSNFGTRTSWLHPQR